MFNDKNVNIWILVSCYSVLVQVSASYVVDVCVQKNGVVAFECI